MAESQPTTPTRASWRSRLLSVGLAALVLAIGGGVFATLWATAPDPDRDDTPAAARKVRAFESHPGTHRIAITSYGQSQAADDWTAKAEVEGNVETMYDEFDDGHVIPKDTVIVTLDDTDYQLALRQANVEVKSNEAQIAELDQRERDNREILDLRKRQLEFAKSDFDRSEKQLAQGLVTPAAHQRVESAYLDRVTTLEDLENELELIPIQRDLLAAQLEAAQIRVERAQRDIDRCTVRMPFTALCIGRQVERHEKVERGESIGTFMALEKAEVLAMVEPRKALMLFPNARHEFYGSIDLTSELFNSEMRRRLQKYLVPADVTWRVGERRAQWRGRATRVSAIVDERSRTAPAVIEVEDAFTDIRPGVRPALVPGMFLEVTLYGDTLEGVHVVPRDALREGRVHIERDGELVIQPVHVVALEEEIAVIDGGLEEGDKVIITDLFPAMDGMRITSELVANPVSHRPELPELESDLTPE